MDMPKTFAHFLSHLSYVLILPVFFLGFLALYTPSAMEMYLEMDGGRMAFNASILTAILLGVLVAARVPVMCLWRHMHFTWTRYVLWCFAEVLIASLFMGLYMTLIYHGQYPYFDVTARCLLFSVMILIFPYVIITMSVVVIDYEHRINETHYYEDQSQIRFVDNAKRVKLVLAVSAVVCIEARENYVLIRYLDAARMREYVLRNSMKNIETMVAKHNIVRCQRSYFVNPQHVRALRHDKDGVVVAELDVESIQPIPVSPNYYANLEKLL